MTRVKGPGGYLHQAARGCWELIFHELDRKARTNDLFGVWPNRARDKVLARVQLKLGTVKNDYESIALSLDPGETVEIAQAASALRIPYYRTEE